MKKGIVVLILICALLWFMSIACVDGGEVNGAGSLSDSSSATATSAAQEFHAQLTLIARTEVTPSP